MNPFFRNIGAVKKRYLGGVAEWVGEDKYCDASRSIVFKNSFGYSLRGPLQFKIAYRRLFSGNYDLAVRRLELGFIPIPSVGKNKISGAELSETLNFIFQTEVINRLDQLNSNNSIQKTTTPLITYLYKSFPGFFLHSTTSKNIRGANLQAEPWWVQSGEAQVVIQLNKNEMDTTSFEPIEVLKRKGFRLELFHKRKSLPKFQGGNIPLWLIALDTGSEHDAPPWWADRSIHWGNPAAYHAARQLRLHIVRLHAEKECLNIILHAVNEKRVPTNTDGDFSSDNLQSCFAHAMKTLAPRKKNISKFNDLLRAAFRLDVLVNLNERENLFKLIDHIRPQWAQTLKTQLVTPPAHPIAYNMNGGDDSIGTLLRPPALPLTSRQAPQSEPVLASEHYEYALKIIQNMSQVLERSPASFKGINEEALRQHFLVQLNGAFGGAATGETFNYNGKTDILLRENGSNVFIAECKFWDGPKQFTETISQLIGYAAWRDSKTVILVFNRGGDTTSILAKIDERARAHPNFRRIVTFQHESGFRYVFHQKNDVNREFILTVLVFDIPV